MTSAIKIPHPKPTAIQPLIGCAAIQRIELVGGLRIAPVCHGFEHPTGGDQTARSHARSAVMRFESSRRVVKEMPGQPCTARVGLKKLSPDGTAWPRIDS